MIHLPHAALVSLGVLLGVLVFFGGVLLIMTRYERYKQTRSRKALFDGDVNISDNPGPSVVVLRSPDSAAWDQGADPRFQQVPVHPVPGPPLPEYSSFVASQRSKKSSDLYHPWGAADQSLKGLMHAPAAAKPESNSNDKHYDPILAQPRPRILMNVDLASAMNSNGAGVSPLVQSNILPAAPVPNRVSPILHFDAPFNRNDAPWIVTPEQHIVPRQQVPTTGSEPYEHLKARFSSSPCHLSSPLAQVLPRTTSPVPNTRGSMITPNALYYPWFERSTEQVVHPNVDPKIPQDLVASGTTRRQASMKPTLMV